MADILQFKPVRKKVEEEGESFLAWKCKCGNFDLWLLFGGEVYCDKCSSVLKTLRHFDPSDKP